MSELTAWCLSSALKMCGDDVTNLLRISNNVLRNFMLKTTREPVLSNAVSLLLLLGELLFELLLLLNWVMFSSLFLLSLLLTALSSLLLLSFFLRFFVCCCCVEIVIERSSIELAGMRLAKNWPNLDKKVNKLVIQMT